MTDRLECKLPCVRKDNLVVQTLKDEILIYDLKRHRAHCLNSTAALIWEQCDGKRTVRDALTEVNARLNTPVNEDIIWYTLAQFEKARLLEEKLPHTLSVSHLTRRELMARAGKAAALLLPLVSSILAPEAAQAASCLKRGSVCTTSDECCVGSCRQTGRVFRCR